VSSDQSSALRARIREILADDLQWQGSPAELTDDLPLITDHIVDSLGLLRLVERLESEFAIRVRDEDVVAANFGSIAQIARYVETATGAS
jgi:acyl carrier protein